MSKDTLRSENAALEARVADQSAYILRLRKAIIDATNNAAPLDSGKWIYGIDDSVLQWPEALTARVAELVEVSTQLESLQKDLEEVKRTVSRYEAQIDAQSEEIIELQGRLRAPQSHNITTELSEILRREVGYGCLDSCIQKAQSWDAVSALLDGLYSGWKANPGTRKDAALAAIKDLADQASQQLDLHLFAKRMDEELEKHDIHGFEPVVLAVAEEVLGYEQQPAPDVAMSVMEALSAILRKAQGRTDTETDECIDIGAECEKLRKDVAGLDITELRELMLILRGTIGGAMWTLGEEEKELAERCEKVIFDLSAKATGEEQ